MRGGGRSERKALESKAEQTRACADARATAESEPRTRASVQRSARCAQRPCRPRAAFFRPGMPPPVPPSGGPPPTLLLALAGVEGGVRLLCRGGEPHPLTAGGALDCSNKRRPLQWPEELIKLTFLNALERRPLLVDGGSESVRPVVRGLRGGRVEGGADAGGGGGWPKTLGAKGAVLVIDESELLDQGKASRRPCARVGPVHVRARCPTASCRRWTHPT